MMKPSTPIFSFDSEVYRDPGYLAGRFDELTGRRAEKERIAAEAERKKREQDADAALFWNGVFERVRKAK